MLTQFRWGVELSHAAVLLLHPLLALCVIAWMVRQHRWRQRGMSLKGEDRKRAVAEHERHGDLLYIAIWCLVTLGITVNIWHRMTTEGASFPAAALPNGAGGLHAGGGLLGLGLVTVLWRKGRRTKALREAGEKFAMEKQRHGRASDVILILAAVHAFLGFLWLLSLLT